MDKEVHPQVAPPFEALFVDSLTGQTGDVIAELRLPRETLAVGGKIPLAFTRHVPCDTCKGTGGAADAPPCTKCEGKGRVKPEPVVPDAITIETTCPTCDGRGFAAEHACKECERGYSKVEASVEVEIPMGSAPGMQLRVSGQGHIRAGKPQGDVVLVVAAGAEEASAAAQKLPLFIFFVIITIIVLVLAAMMARQ